MKKQEQEEPERRTGGEYSIERGGFANRLWEESFVYIKTVVNTLTQPFLLLDNELRVIAANESYYTLFQDEPENVEQHYFNTIGGGVWDNPLLTSQLNDIFTNNIFLKGFEVNTNFPNVGKKILIISARRVYRETKEGHTPSEIILLAMEDATDLMRMAELIIKHRGDSNIKIPEHKIDLEKMMNDLENEMISEPVKKKEGNTKKA